MDGYGIFCLLYAGVVAILLFGKDIPRIATTAHRGLEATDCKPAALLAVKIAFWIAMITLTIWLLAMPHVQMARE